jgi:hypothetical protein
MQPGCYDDGGEQDIVAHLDDFVNLEISKNHNSYVDYNLCDCAIASIDDGIDLSYMVDGIGTPTGITYGRLGMKVRKLGRTTGYTESEIIAVNTTVKLRIGSGVAVFTDQIVARKMCEEGDSGAAVFDKGTKVVGILFASGHRVSLINKIHNVFKLLDIELP